MLLQNAVQCQLRPAKSSAATYSVGTNSTKGENRVRSLNYAPTLFTGGVLPKAQLN